eukprot:6302640-Amphidinium_carterae.1
MQKLAINGLHYVMLARSTHLSAGRKQTSSQLSRIGACTLLNRKHASSNKLLAQCSELVPMEMLGMMTGVYTLQKTWSVYLLPGQVRGDKLGLVYGRFLMQGETPRRHS